MTAKTTTWGGMKIVACPFARIDHMYVECPRDVHSEVDERCDGCVATSHETEHGDAECEQ